MAAKIKQIDQYIAKSADFAKPIMTHMRDLIHKACPDVEEKIKWGMPSFEYKGPMCGFAAFKQHASFGFWKAAIMKDKDILLNDETRGSMGHLGKITSLKDLPNDKTLTRWIKEAMKLNEDGIKVPKSKPKHPKKELTAPGYMIKEINRDKAAKQMWANFSPSHKREYIEWITEAKSEETREKRMVKMMEWLNEGKSRNWKYQTKK
jgi:uncharacterized protein YdeI (YjbR/CyaY-like superfamily)